MGQTQKHGGERVLAQPRLAPGVHRTIKGTADAVYTKSMVGPLVADLIALWCERPADAIDFHDVGALPASRAVYDALWQEASDRGVSLEQLVATMTAQWLQRPDLLDPSHAIKRQRTLSEQEVLPIGDDAAA
ncbi:hypothetical protein ACL02S_22290 [Nocardia sp. 004]|uniref:hypothetical protein n=1 Tax=Nocardia sp. 004 TaxID=3385978 RepID=UPI0039A30EF1